MRHLPTYTEVTGRAAGSIAPAKPSKKPKGTSNIIGASDDEAVEEEGELPDLDELEEFEDVADIFESTYNFRFEEP